MSTVEASALDNFIVRMTRLWWGFEATLERWKMSMREHRIDPDFNPSEEDVRTLKQAIDRLRLSHYYNGDSGGGGDRRMLNWILGVLSLLVVAGVVGGITLYGRLSSLESTVNSGITAHEQRIRRLEDINERRYRGTNNEQ